MSFGKVKSGKDLEKVWKFAVIIAQEPYRGEV